MVFNTGMVGYQEALTDPSYRGQVLALTYPLIGNYGVPEGNGGAEFGTPFESSAIQVAGLIVSEAAENYSHRNAAKSLADWLREQRVPALAGVDVRGLTKHLRQTGAMLAKLLVGDEDTEFRDPNRDNVVSLVSVKETVIYPRGK